MDGLRGTLYDLIDMDNPDKVLAEVDYTVGLMFSDFDFPGIRDVFSNIRDLYGGKYPGYRKCNTRYHDFRHTTDVFLAMARLIHGVHVAGYCFDRENVKLGLIAALMHDTGYIQKIDDPVGTGAKYTTVHVERSVDYMTAFLRERGFSETAIRNCACIIMSTSLDLKFDEIPFVSGEVEKMGKIHLAADLIGQMADRIYLEKLLFLYKEFTEGQITAFDSEFDLLKKTSGFYQYIRNRTLEELDNIDRYMGDHFRVRWNVDGDLYRIEIEKNLNYLNHILENHPDNYREKLRRSSKVGGLQD